MTYERIKSIERSPFPLTDRLNLVLAYAQQKPTTLVSVYSFVNPKTRVSNLSEKTIRQAKKSITMAGLAYHANERETIRCRNWNGGGTHDVDLVEMIAGKDSRTVDAAMQAYEEGNERAMGRYLGFPETAIQAYLGERQPFMGVIAPANHPIDMFTGFVFSRDHWKEEFCDTSVRWHDTVKRLSPALYREAIKRTKNEKQTKSNLFWRDEYLFQNDYFLS